MRLGAMEMRSRSWGGKGWKRGRKKGHKREGMEGKEKEVGKSRCTRDARGKRRTTTHRRHVLAPPVYTLPAQVRTRNSYAGQVDQELHINTSLNTHITVTHTAVSVLRVFAAFLLGPSGAAAQSSPRTGVAVLIPSAPQLSGTGGMPRWLHPEAGNTVLPRSALASAAVNTPRGARLSRPSLLVIVLAAFPRPWPPRRRPTTQWPPGGCRYGRRRHPHVLWQTHLGRSL